MTIQSRARCVVGRGFLLVTLAVLGTAAQASVGAVTKLTGTLLVQKADGSFRVLSRKSEIVQGDILNTQGDSFAQIQFDDGATLTLKPNTSIKIETYNFSRNEPVKDRFEYLLFRGGVRAKRGEIGSRGDPEAYRLKTGLATIRVRGTAFGADLCTSGSAGQGPCRGGKDAVYIAAADGQVDVTNDGGSVSILAGQLGTSDENERKPRFLSTDPGLQFTPPAAFVQSLTGGSSINSGRSLECVVRR